MSLASGGLSAENDCWGGCHRLRNSPNPVKNRTGLQFFSLIPAQTVQVFVYLIYIKNKSLLNEKQQPPTLTSVGGIDSF